MKLLGIDPGSVSGAYAFIDTELARHEPSAVVVGDVPTVNKMVDPAEFARLVRAYGPDYAIVEQVSVMPKQGIVSGFRFGMGCGMIQGVILGCGVPMHLVPASAWKKVYKLSNDKELSRALAIRTFPNVTGLSRKKDHGRAEALLLAQFLKSNILKL